MDTRHFRLILGLLVSSLAPCSPGAERPAWGQGARLPAPPSPSAKGAEPSQAVSLENQPYQIRAWLRVEPSARMTSGEIDRLIADWLELIERFVGAPWKIEIQPDTPSTILQPPDRLTADSVEGSVEGADKGWFLSIEAREPGGGLLLSGREYDAATRQLGPIFERPSPFRRDSARELYRLTWRIFAPRAEIERSGEVVQLRVQGSGLPTADPSSQLAGPDSVFKPFLIGLGPNQTVRGVREVPYTYLKIRADATSRRECDVLSGLRRPLPQQVAGRSRLVALGAKSASQPTRFRFVSTRESDKQLVPVPGAVLTARTYPDGPPVVVGTTGRDGEISLPAGFSEGLVLLRLLAGGTEPLREIPVLPGESTKLRQIPVDERSEAVALEYRIKALQDQILDTIARRAILERRLQSRTQGQAWEEVKALLEEYKKLPTQEFYSRRIEQLRDDAQRRQTELQVAILTQTAQGAIAEVETMVRQYMDDEPFRAFQEALSQSTQPAPAERSRAGQLPSSLKGATPTPPPGPQGDPVASPESRTAPSANPPPAISPVVGGPF